MCKYFCRSFSRIPPSLLSLSRLSFSLAPALHSPLASLWLPSLAQTVIRESNVYLHSLKLFSGGVCHGKVSPTRCSTRITSVVLGGKTMEATRSAPFVSTNCCKDFSHTIFTAEMARGMAWLSHSVVYPVTAPTRALQYKEGQSPACELPYTLRGNPVAQYSESWLS